MLYRNDYTGDNKWLEVKLSGPTGSNRDAIGAWVRVTRAPGEAPLVRQIGTVTQYLGQSERLAHFGLGNFAGPIHEVEIEWPNGSVETLSNVDINQVVWLPEPAALLGGLVSTAALLALARRKGKV